MEQDAVMAKLREQGKRLKEIGREFGMKTKSVSRAIRRHYAREKSRPN
jgi:lambda repressor-like predicted transcriptional regulator